MLHCGLSGSDKGVTRGPPTPPFPPPKKNLTTYPGDRLLHKQIIDKNCSIKSDNIKIICYV